MTGKRRLTPMQETFAVGIAMGKTRHDAAVAAGYSPHTAQVQGNQLALLPAVGDRIEELASLATAREVMGLQERREKLTVIAREDNRTEKGSLIRGGNIEAIKELGRLDNPKLHQSQSVSNPSINIVVVDAQTADILKRMAGGERREGEGVSKGEVIDLPHKKDKEA